MTIKRALNKIDIKKIEDDIKRDDKILNKYYLIQDNISKLQNELLSYKQELLLLTTKDEYKYNPNCEYNLY